LPAAPHPCAEFDTAAFCPPREWEGNKNILKDNGKEINQELHTIPLLSRTLQLSAYQEWEGNKTYIKG
jgi:hypothetical protein